MDKDLHIIDKIFSETHKELVVDAPADGWARLQAKLDKDDAEKYRRRFIGWKRIALVLILLFSSFIIYEAGIFESAKSGDHQMVATKPSIQELPALNSAKTIKEKDTNILREQNMILDEPLVPEKVVEFNELQDNLLSSIEPGNHSNNYYSNESIVFKESKNKLHKLKLNPSVGIATPTFDVATPDGNSAYSEEIIQTESDKNKALQKEILKTTSAVHDKISIEKIVFFKQYFSTVMMPANIIELQKEFSQLHSKSNFPKDNHSNFKPFWTAMPFVSNDWNMYRLDNDVRDITGSAQDDEKVEVSSRERNEASFSAGVIITRQLSKHIGIKSGIIYASTNIAISPQNIYAEKQNGELLYKYITSSGYGFIKPGFGATPAIGDSITSAEAQHTLQVLSIPLSFAYRLGKHKFSFIPSAGISLNFIARAKIKTEVFDAQNRESVEITKLEGTRKYYTGFVADVNIQYSINNKLAVNLLPNFRYALSPITKNNVVKTFPYSFGLGAGITFRF